MTLALHLPSEVEARLEAGAALQGISVEEYALRLLGEAVGQGPVPNTPAATVAWWKRHGLLGVWAHRTDLPDSPEYARQLREEAQRRSA